MTTTLRINRSQKLHEALTGRKNIFESVSGGITALKTLEKADKLPAKTLSILSKIPLESAEDFEKAIQKIAATYKKESTLRKFFEDSNISLDDKGKYFELLADESKMGEASKFAKSKITAQPTTTKTTGTPEPGEPEFTGPSQTTGIVQAPKSWVSKVASYIQEIKQISDSFVITTPTDPKLKKIFDNIVEAIQNKQYKNADEVTQGIYIEILGSERYQALIKKARIEGNSFNIVKYATPEERKLFAEMNDYLVDVANKHLIALERTESILSRLIKDEKAERARLGKKFSWQIAKYTFSGIHQLLYNIIFKWLFPLSPTQWGAIPFIYSKLTGKTMSVGANWGANILIGMMEPLIFQKIREINSQIKGFTNEPDIKDSIESAPPEQEQKITKSQMLANSVIDSAEIVSKFWFTSGWGIRFAAGKFTESGISSWLVNRSKKEVYSDVETQQIERQKGETKRARIKILDIERKILKLKYRAIKSDNDKAQKLINLQEKNLEEIAKQKIITLQQIDDIEQEIKEIEQIVSPVSGTTQSSELPQISNIPGVMPTAKPPVGTNKAQGTL